jgi:hypothetical protein
MKYVTNFNIHLMSINVNYDTDNRYINKFQLWEYSLPRNPVSLELAIDMKEYLDPKVEG